MVVNWDGTNNINKSILTVENIKKYNIIIS